MHEPTLDDETIAALLDGRLPPAERERVLALIAADDAWREVLGEAAGVLTDAGASSVPSRPADLPAPSRASYRAWTAPARLLAASLLIVAGAVWLRSRTPASPAPDVLALAITTEQSSGAEAYSARGWPTTRAGGDEFPLEVRSARLGVLAVDLLRATVRGDSTGAHLARRLLSDALQGVTGGALVVGRLDSATSTAALRAVLSDVRVLGDSTQFDLAAQLELLRMAGVESPSMRALVSRVASARSPEQRERVSNASGERAGVATDSLAMILDALVR